MGGLRLNNIRNNANEFGTIIHNNHYYDEDGIKYKGDMPPPNDSLAQPEYQYHSLREIGARLMARRKLQQYEANRREYEGMRVHEGDTSIWPWPKIPASGRRESRDPRRFPRVLPERLRPVAGERQGGLRLNIYNRRPDFGRIIVDGHRILMDKWRRYGRPLGRDVAGNSRQIFQELPVSLK